VEDPPLQVDGVGSVGLVHLLLDSEPDERDPSAPGAPMTGSSGDAHDGWLPRAPDALRWTAGVSLTVARAGAHALLHPRETLDWSVRRPWSTCSSATLEEIRAALGGKLNDVVLCAATGGLRALLMERGEDPPRQGLRAMVRVSIRPDGDHSELGNKVSSMFVELAVAEADQRRRYELVRAAAEQHKAGGGRWRAAPWSG
jgi:hypothetical protein